MAGNQGNKGGDMGKGAQGNQGDWAKDQDKASQAGRQGGQMSEGGAGNDPQRQSDMGKQGGKQSGGDWSKDADRPADAGRQGAKVRVAVWPMIQTKVLNVSAMLASKAMLTATWIKIRNVDLQFCDRGRFASRSQSDVLAAGPLPG